MTRRSLRPQLNQIRSWVREGRTDAWIAHKLDATVQQIAAFKIENELAPPGVDDNGSTIDPGDEIDLRAEDDALVAVELEKAEAEKAEADKLEAERVEAERLEAERVEAERAQAAEENDEDEDDKPKRRRGGRGGRGRRKAGPRAFEGTFDHGEEGYGLWLDPDVAEDPIYAEHWAGHRQVEVTVEEDQIVIRRAGGTVDETS